MREHLILFLVDIMLGYVPQAAGCAICLFTLTAQPLKSRRFFLLSLLYAVIAMAIRLLYNIGLINFGFHTIIIWMIFIFVAILYLKLPVLQSTVAILVSGILITAAEIVTAIALSLAIGSERFNAMMNNTATTQGQIEKAICGIPMNFLFVLIVLLLNCIVRRKRARKGVAEPQKTEEALEDEWNDWRN